MSLQFEVGTVAFGARAIIGHQRRCYPPQDPLASSVRAIVRSFDLEISDSSLRMLDRSTSPSRFSCLLCSGHEVSSESIGYQFASKKASIHHTQTQTVSCACGWSAPMRVRVSNVL